jgi:alpha-L-fucosidase
MTDVPDELRDLIDEYLGSEMDEARFARLQSLLAADSRARAYFVRYTQLDFQLLVDMRADHAADHAMDGIRKLAGSGMAADSIEADVAAVQAEAASGAGDSNPPDLGNDERPQPAGKSPMLSFPGDVGRRRWRFLSKHAVLGSLATLTTAVVVSVIVWHNRAPDRGTQLGDRNGAPAAHSIPHNGPSIPSAGHRSAILAQFACTKDCRWEGTSADLKAGSSVPAGIPLHLAKGTAEIRFDVGVKLIVQGPAVLQLLAADCIRLDVGKATVEIKDERAHGFRVITPGATFVDQGTEFGVDVSPVGNAKIHVFRGIVDVEQEIAGNRGSRMTHRLQERVGARMEAGEEGLTLVDDTGECFIRSMDDTDRDRHTLAYWRFEDRPLGSTLPHTSKNVNPICATTDSTFNGNDLFAYNPDVQPRISGNVAARRIPQTGVANRGCLDTARIVTWPGRKPAHSDLYTKSRFSHAAPLDVQAARPPQWTIEASIKANLLDGVRTFVGRDGCDQSDLTQPGWISPRLAFQINRERHFAIRFVDCAGRTHEAMAESLLVATDTWYHLAATSDGRDLRLYVDRNDGRGYRLEARCRLPAVGSTALDAGSGNAEWSIGRGRDPIDGMPGESFVGWIDEVRISDVALEPGKFLFAKATAQPLAGRKSTPAATAVASPSSKQAAPPPSNLAAKTLSAWCDARFGLFLHWGPYSVYGGSYKGKKLWSAEWIQENAKIPWEEYSQTAAAWNPEHFDADAWVAAAKAAGMRYIVVTAKHHDGFAIYPSKISDYNLLQWSKSYHGPDPLMALKKACEKQGLLLGIYYSILEFRGSPKGFRPADEQAVAHGFRYETLGPKPYATAKQIADKAKGQIRELVERYHPAILWFDAGDWDKMGRWTKEDAAETLAMIRKTGGDVLVNDRLGVPGDFADREGEGAMPARPLQNRPWEFCWNLGAFWGYNPRQYQEDVGLLKAPEHYVETLVRTASLGGNYLLNVGPQPDGRLPPKAVEYLHAIGRWVHAHGACIYGTSPSPFDEKPAWGYVTLGRDRLYLIVKNWPVDGVIQVPAMAREVRGAAVLGRPEKGSLQVTAANGKWSVAAAGSKPAEPFAVIVIDLAPDTKEPAK